MVKHIVLFRLDPDMETGRKAEVMATFKKGIENLPAKIPFIRKIEVGLNVNADEEFDIALYSEFDTMDEVKAYAVHPEHVAVAALLKDCKKSRACVDYEY
ncbi:MAG: Dabb family protein [Paraprevotella sp.]|nr:Dabb family protein [Paraprevotella sp.]